MTHLLVFNFVTWKKWKDNFLVGWYINSSFSLKLKSRLYFCCQVSYVKMEMQLARDIRIGRYLLVLLFLAINDFDFTDATHDESNRITSNHLNFKKIRTGN